MKRLLWIVATLVAVVGGTLGVRTQGVVPPILLVVNSASANPYGPYLAEILRAEGLNSFTVAQLSSVTTTDLTNASVVILADTPLSSDQSTMFSNYVGSGGRLVSMNPDSKLLPALGLAAVGSATSEGYFALNQTSFATGFPTTTMPFHGQAQNLAPAPEAQVLATLYTNATTATPYPAAVRFRSTVTFSYDLARSVVYTRQGNPANATDRDGSPPFRTEDIFYNAIDLNKVGIPYADVQMRMFARAINDLLSDLMPLPRMWYFPGTNRTLVVLTGDSHANPQSYFDQEISTIESYGGRISIYAYGGTAPSASSAATWRSKGHELGMHPAAYQYSRTIDAAFQANLSWFLSMYNLNPSPTTRIHQVEWQGWVDAAKIEANYGIALDTSFYTWGPAVIYPDGHQAHGYINGSGQPMRFVDQTGALVPVFQQVTSLVDEQLIAGTGTYSENLTGTAATAVSQQIIDASQAGDYAAVTTQFHVDYFGFADAFTWATNTMNYARSLGIPMWPAQRWLNYTTARYATTVTNVLWSAGSRQLSFTASVPAGSETQSLTVPYTFGGYGITSVTVDGTATAGTQQSVSGRPTLFIGLAAGAHSVVATYNTPLPTVALSVAPTTINQGQTATLSWSTANAATVTIDQGIGTVAASGTKTVSPLATTTYTLTATNSAGTVMGTATLTVIPPPPTVTLSVSPTAIAAGDPATLTWSSTNAATVTIDQGIGAVSASGTQIVSPPATTTYTITATNITGSATATASLTVNPAPPGASLKFNGSSQRARFTALPAMTAFTVEGWVKRTTDTGGWETFFANTDNSYSGETFGVYVDGGNADCGSNPPDQFAWAYVRASGGWFVQCSGVSANLNAWHHIAISRDASNVARIFIDGVLKNSVNGPAASSTTTGFFNIGDAGDAATEFFPGLLDEVRVSSVARYTSTFAVQTSRFAPDASTVALYHLDQGSGQTLTDSSGNNRNGVLGTTSSTETSDPVWSTDVPFTGPTLPTVAFSVSPTSITSGGSATLSWTTANATSVSIDQGIGSVALSGTRTVNPTTTTTYTLTATNASGSTTASTTLTVTPPLPTASLSAQPTTITQGQSTTLSWSTTNATTVSISPGVGTVGTSGSVTVTPSSTTTYTLTATNVTGSTTASTTVTVNPPLPTASLTVSPTTISQGQAATLSWSTTNATSVSISPGIGTVGTSGSIGVTPSVTTTYTLTATNVTGTATATTTLTVTPAPPIASLTVLPTSIAQGGSATLSWSTTNATSVTIDQNIGPVAASGSLTVSPGVTTMYTLTATNSTGTTTVSATLTVTPPPPTASLTAVPATITLGQSSTLSWSTTNATSVSISPGIGTVAASGSVSVTPSVTTTYTLTATNANGSTTATATVTVNPPPPTASLGVSPTTINLGQTATLSWSTTNATTVSISPGIGAVSATGTLTVSPAATTTYTLTATNVTGSATSSATLAVVIPLPTVTASVTPTTITAGSSASLSWSTTNASTVSISPGIGSVATSGTVTVTPAATTTYTVTATNLTGSASAAATLTVNPAPPGSSLQFNGSSQRARFTTLPAMTVFTVEAWVKRTADTGRYETFLSNANTGYDQETVGVYVDGGNTDCGSNPPDQFAWAYTQVGGGWFFQCSGVTANLNAWHHIAVSRDSTNTTRIFIDGVLRGTITGTAAPTTSTGAFGIGEAGDAATEYFPGLVDEVRISSAVRYTSSFTPQTTPFTTDASTVALYHLDEGTGQTLSDSSGNARNGVLGTSSAVEAVDPQWSADSPVH